MEKHRGWLITGFMIVIISQLRGKYLDYGVRSKIESKLVNFREFPEDAPRVMDALDTDKLFDKFIVKNYFDSFIGDFVFELDKPFQNTVAEIVIDFDKDFKICKLSNPYEKLKSRGLSYIIGLEYYTERVGYFVEKYYYYCILLLERPDRDTSSPDLFTSKEAQHLKGNSERLFFFFGKAIQAFAEMNFIAMMLHGDIRPKNIMVKFKQAEKDSDRDFDPVIIGLHNALQFYSKEDLCNDALRYSSKYRPPEMSEKTFVAGKSLDESWAINWENYKYSKEMVEDVYALGKTIEEVLKVQSEFISESSCEIQGLRTLQNEMIKEKEKIEFKNKKHSKSSKVIKVRKNMKEIFGMFFEILKKCNEENPSDLHQQSITLTEAAIEKLNQKSVYII